MHAKTLVIWFVLPMAGTVACSGSNNSGSTYPSAVDAALCTWPTSFTSSGDEYAVGCWAHPSSGTTNADQYSCSASEYALHCVGDVAWPDSGCEVLTMPAPDSSLGCRLLPLPTPSNQNYYCCPCGQGQTSLSDASVSIMCPT